MVLLMFLLLTTCYNSDELNTPSPRHVHDEDFGHEEAVGFAGSLVGLSDDLLGYVDVAVQCLPPNTKLSGWFELYQVGKAWPRGGRRSMA